MEQNKREQFIIRRIGGTTYKVRVVFNKSGGETMEDKILRIVRNDIPIFFLRKRNKKPGMKGR